MKTLFSILLILCITASCSIAQAKYEPAAGCYVGAFIQNDPVLHTEPYGDVAKFESWTRKHATYLTYNGYGQSFPSQLAAYYKSQNSILKIGYEPNNGLAEVKDSTYLRNWARAARESGAMIFLRWASEMNGNWVAWHGDPSQYIAKWRLVWKVMKEEAPNVAMVWTPNDVPNNPGYPPDNPFAYYPGDEYVDWVGVDFYCVYYYENGTPERVDPREKLKVIYDVYSTRKPIMISEWGVAHNTSRGDTSGIQRYAITYLDSLYSHLRSEFPKVKAVTYFDYNSSTVDWKLTNDAVVLAAYKNLVSGEYFLGTPQSNIPFVSAADLADGNVISAPRTITASVLSSLPIDSLVMFVDSIRSSVLTTASYEFGFDPADVPDGKHRLRIIAYPRGGYSNFLERNVIIDKGGEYFIAVIDNGESGFSSAGSWTVSTSQPDRYGSNYLFSLAGNGSSTATWRPDIPRAGQYSVYAWWSIAPNRATNAPYTINHSSGSTTVRVNQQINGGEWNSLGNYPFNAGTGGSVVLNNDANNIVIADAVRFEWAFGVTNIQGGNNGITGKIELQQNFPNPLNSTTEIRYFLPYASLVTLRIYDILGREIATALHEFQQAGSHSVPYTASSLASGIYVYKLTADAFSSSKTMIVLK